MHELTGSHYVKSRLVMRGRFVVGVLVLVVSSTIQPAGQNRRPSSALAPAPSRPPEGWPDSVLGSDVSSLQTTNAALPRPSITEPFAIGEALHDPSRVGPAVVSLLSLMGVEIVPDNPLRRLTIGTRLRLSESEVRALIAMGIADADAQAQDASGPFTFADLHKRLAPSLPGISVEGLAEIYARDYEAHPDKLAPQVLLGQPIEPDTPLLRTELWLLLVDGLLAPEGSRNAAMSRAPRFVLARMAAAQDTSIAGMLQRVFQPPEFRRWQRIIRAQLEARLPLILASSLTLTRGARGHEGHGGPGQTVTIDARFNPPPIEIEGTLPGALEPKGNSLGGITITWSTDGTIRSHAPNAPPTRTETVRGAPRLPFTLKSEPARGRGLRMSAPGLITLTLDDPGDLIQQTYGVSIFDLGPVTVSTTAVMEWHAADTLEIDVRNEYNVGSAVARLTRSGRDLAVGTLALEADGNYRGVVVLESLTHKVTMPGKSCAPDEAASWQLANVVAVPIAETATSLPTPQSTVVGPGQQGPSNPPAGLFSGQTSGAFYTSVRTRRGFNFRNGQPSRYFRLEFTPATSPLYESQNPCLDEIPSDPTHSDGLRATPNFIPLNDAQWTIVGYGSVGARDTENRAGYGIAAPLARVPNQPATLDYEETRTPENNELLSRLGGLLKAESTWRVSVTHTKVE